jgi:hypothetical protein
MKDKTQTRKLLLSTWENYRALLEEASNKEELLLRAGGLLAVSRLLNALHHGGDGTDPIKVGEWEHEALKLIAQAQEEEILVLST